MRSITGPISRLWVKFYKFATWEASAPRTDPSRRTVPSRKYRQLLDRPHVVARIQAADDRTRANMGRQRERRSNDGGVVTDSHSGGYQTPQLNTADKLFLGVSE